MNKQFGNDDLVLAQYVTDVFCGDDPVYQEVVRRQAEAGMPDIQVPRLDGLHLEVLARLSGAQRAVEVGTLAGWSGVCLLRGMGEGGGLHTFELEEKHAAVARGIFESAGFGPS